MHRTTLAALLADRRLVAGEAVTVLVPLLQTLDDLHALDCTHGAVSAGTVVFDDTGKAMLDGWDDCVEHRQGVALAPSFRAAMLEDCRRFVELVRLVVPAGAVIGDGGGPPARPLLADELARLERGRREPFMRECEEMLFTLAVPLPVELSQQAVGEQYDWGSETDSALARVRAEVDAVTRDDAEADRLVRRARSWLAGVPVWLGRRRASVAAWWSAGERGRRVRPRTVAVAAVVCVLAVVGALVTLPAGGSGSSGSSAAPAAGAVPATTAAAGAVPATTGGAVSAPTPAAVPATMPAAGAAAVLTDDPVAAATALLGLRTDCLATRSPSCLRGAEQESSAALAADAASMAGPYPTGQHPTGPHPAGGPGASATQAAPRVLRLVQTVGASALLEVVEAASDAQREPASLLLVKGEAGWRIRELFGDWP